MPALDFLRPGFLPLHHITTTSVIDSLLHIRL